MITLDANEKDLNALLYEPQLARDLQRAGWKQVRGESEASGEIDGAAIKIWCDEGGEVKAEITLDYSSHLVSYIVEHADNMRWQTLFKSEFAKNAARRGYVMITAQRGKAVALGFAKTPESTSQALAALNGDLPELKRLLAVATEEAVQASKQREGRQRKPIDVEGTALGWMGQMGLTWLGMFAFEQVFGRPQGLVNIGVMIAWIVGFSLVAGQCLKRSGIARLIKKCASKALLWVELKVW